MNCLQPGKPGRARERRTLTAPQSGQRAVVHARVQGLGATHVATGVGIESASGLSEPMGEFGVELPRSYVTFPTRCFDGSEADEICAHASGRIARKVNALRWTKPNSLRPYPVDQHFAQFAFALDKA